MSLQILRLLHLADSAFPIGATAHSFGLETLTATGMLTPQSLHQFFSDLLWETGQMEAVFGRLAYRCAGTGDTPLSLAQSFPLTGAIIVTQPQDVAVADALRSIAMFETLNVPILGVVENMAGDFFGTGGGEKLANERHVPFLGRIPLDAEVRKGGDYGRPIVIAEPENPAGQAFYQLAQTVAARASVMMLQSADVIPLNVIG